MNCRPGLQRFRDRWRLARWRWRVKESLEAEFTAFVAGRGQALLRIAYALSGDRRVAEDLVQGALGKAYARWPRIHSNAEAYVRRIIYNDRASSWRRPGRNREVLVAE